MRSPLLFTLMTLVASTMALAQTTQEAVAAPEKVPEIITRVYDLRDLMMNVGDYPFTGKIGVPPERKSVAKNERLSFCRNASIEALLVGPSVPQLPE